MNEKCINKVPSGIEGLDDIIEGGFSRGSLILLAGNPGTGKTIFSASFLYYGVVKYGERSIYVSFAEGRETFFNNMRAFGFDFEKLEKAGSFRFLDLVTAKEEAAPTILEMIFSEVSKVEANRLVIDSFSALAQAFKETHEIRVVLHTILNRISKLFECTTILIVERPYGESRIGFGIEEFIADVIIILRKSRFKDRILRELELLKVRGTPTPETRLLFTLKGGFKVFPPFKEKAIRGSDKFQPRPDTEERFSTGSPYLDEMLGGGYPKGSSVLLEVDEYISTTQCHLIIAPTDHNFISHGRGVLAIPSRGVDYNLVRKWFEEGGLARDEINRLLRVCIKEYQGLKPEPPIVAFKGEDILDDYTKYVRAEQELREKTGQPVLHIIGADTLIDTYGVKATISILRECATRIRETGGLGIFILKPGYPRLAKILGGLVDVHLNITREHGAIIVYGVKPRTNLHVLEIDDSRGYAMPKLTPIL